MTTRDTPAAALATALHSVDRGYTRDGHAASAHSFDAKTMLAAMPDWTLVPKGQVYDEGYVDALADERQKAEATIERLRAALTTLSDAASPGPWTVEASGAYEDGDYNEDETAEEATEVEAGWFRGPRMIDTGDYETLRYVDAEFIVAAVNYVRAALKEQP